MTIEPSTFAWIISRGLRKPSAAKFPCGIPKTIESNETIVAKFAIKPEEEGLDLGELAKRYPCREQKETDA